MRLRFPSWILLAGILASAAIPGSCASDAPALEVRANHPPRPAPSADACLSRWAEAGDFVPEKAPPTKPPATPPVTPAESTPVPPTTATRSSAAVPAPISIPRPSEKKPPPAVLHYGTDPAAADVHPSAPRPSRADPGMSYGTSLACAIASLFLCGGCVAAAWLRIRRTVQAVERLRNEIGLKLQEHDELYQHLESRADELAKRLARSSSERRELSVSNHRASADNRALADELRAALEQSRARELELSEALAIRESLDAATAETTVYVPETETIVALAEEPAEESPPEFLPDVPPDDQPDVPPELTDPPEPETAQAEEPAMAEWNENQLSQPFSTDGPSIFDPEFGADPVPQPAQSPPERVELQAPALPSEREIEGVSSARVRELEQLLEARDEYWERRLAAVESLRATATAQGEELAVVSHRCNELERRVEQLAASAAQGEEFAVVSRRCSELERRIEELAARAAAPAQAPEPPEPPEPIERVEDATSARELELEGQLGDREEELRRRTEALEALQAELASSQRRAEAAERRRAEVEEQILERARDEQARHEGALASASGLEARLAGKDEELRQRAVTIERLQTEVLAKNRQIETAGEHSAELEQRIHRMSQAEQAHLHKEQELHHGWTSRASELEGHLARRDEELRQRGATIERLEGEVLVKNREIEAAVERCAELEKRLQRQEERDGERIGREQDLQRALSMRAAELEERIASLADELRQRSAAAELLQQEIGVKDRHVAGAGERCAELERELQRRAGEEQARQVQERTLESARLLRIAELERELAGRDEDGMRLRGEYAQLAERYQDVSQKLELRVRDLGAQEQHIAEIQGRFDATELGARRVQEDARASDALADELVENRLSTIFKRKNGASADALPELYLDGLEQGDFDHAIQALLGEPEPLGAASVTRLGGRWRGEHVAWKSTPLDREVVYLWADGVHLRAGLEKPETAVLVVVASHPDGSRSVVASESGDPASKEAWLGVLRSLVQRGMNVPRLVVAPGTSGLWAGIDELGWDCARQFCWTHETSELLASLPKKRQSQADKILRAASAADTRAAAKKLRDRFVKRCGVRCAETGDRLGEDWKHLTSYFAFPEDHWAHLRTTQVIEAPLSSLRLRATEPQSGKPSAFVEAALWKLLSAAARSQKKLSAAGPAGSTSAAREPEQVSGGRGRRRSA